MARQETPIAPPVAPKGGTVGKRAIFHSVEIALSLGKRSQATIPALRGSKRWPILNRTRSAAARPQGTATDAITQGCIAKNRLKTEMVREACETTKTQLKLL